jgi:hypothetical protein
VFLPLSSSDCDSPTSASCIAGITLICTMPGSCVPI